VARESQASEFRYSLIDHVADGHPRAVASDWMTFVMGLAEPDIRGDQALSEYLQALKHAKREALRGLSRKSDANTRHLAIRHAQQPIKDHWKAQKDGPAWIPAVFGQQSNAKGHRRHAQNVVALYAAVLDFDNHISRARIEAILHGLCYAAHTSYTHHPQAERWRVIIPLQQPVPPCYAYALYDYFAFRFGGGLDTTCRNPDHLYFLPACPPDAAPYYQQFSTAGVWFNAAFLQPATLAYREHHAPRPAVTAQDVALPAVSLDTLRISQRIKHLIQTGQGPYSSRSEAVFAVVQALLRAGLTDEVIVAVLLNPAYPIAEKPREKGMAWVRAEIARARTKMQTDNGPSRQEETVSTAGATAQSPPRPSQATVLVELAAKTVFFHDPEGVPYATLTVNGHREHWPIRSRAFRDWLCRGFWQARRKAPSSQALTDALGVIDGQARYEGPQYPVSLRVARQKERCYLDLCAPDWRCVEIDATGWRIIPDPPVRFIRRPGMLALPVPRPGGDLAQLGDFLNVTPQQRPLIFAWLVQALQDRGPYPVLIIQGEQGTAKSWLARCLRALIDPSVAALRTTPREERDLLIAASNSHVIALDNLSGIAPWLSDALCRLATGGGFSTRQLYTDTEEVFIQVQRPILLNGIDDIATRHDLLDRALVLNLKPIPDAKRRPETALLADFARARPALLGALLEGMVTALRHLPQTHLPTLPRLADFALWATAAETAWGAAAGDFINAYRQNRLDAVAAGLEGSLVARALRTWCEHQGPRGTWSGTSSELLNQLTPVVGNEAVASAWPKSAKALTGQLKRLATGLRTTGVQVTQRKSADGTRRLVQIDWVGHID
jgi:hypothetical protein